VEPLALVFSSGWASGVNSYLVVLVLGIAERVGGFGQIPDVLGRWEVLGVAGVVGGGSALASHLVKMGGRLAINSSPEPVTNITASLLEDVAVLGVVWFAIEHPYVAATIAGVLLVLGIVMLYFVAKIIRKGWRRWKGKDRPAAYA